MNNKLIISLVSSFALTVGTYAFAQHYSPMGTGFGAPTVSGIANVSSPVLGNIAYDTTAGTFYGYGNGSTWVALSGGANTSLSNLSSVAINTSLMYGAGVSQGRLETPGVANANSNSLLLETGNITGNGRSGSILIHSGQGQESSVINTGDVTVASGDSTAGASNTSGTVSLLTGSSHPINGTSGNIVLETGSANTRGKIQLKNGTEGTSGQVWTSTDTNGSGGWAAVSSPAGTVCGWSDGTLTLNCKGSNPGTSCPTGYTQRTTATGAMFCSAN